MSAYVAPAPLLVPQVYPLPASSATAFNVLRLLGLCAALEPRPTHHPPLVSSSPAPAPAFAEAALLARIPPRPERPAPCLPSFPLAAGASRTSWSSSSPRAQALGDHFQRDRRLRHHCLCLRRAVQPRPGPAQCGYLFAYYLPLSACRASTAPPTLPMSLG